MSDKRQISDNPTETNNGERRDKPMSSQEEREGFVAGLVRAAKDIASGKVRSGISETFGKPLIDAGVDSQAALVIPDQQAQTPVPLEGLVELDSKDRVIKISYADGTSSTPTYDEKGRLVEIKDSDRSTWKQEEGGWNRYNASGDKTEHLDGEMFVTADGEVVARQNDGYTEILSPDGSLTKINTDNSQVHTDAEDRVISTTDQQGRTTFRKPAQYEGEIIRREIEPTVVEDTNGKQLEQIAREHLGPGATEQDVQKHVKEIAHINEIKDPSKPLEGQRLQLPGHTKDGAIVTEDKDHNRKVVWADGVVLVTKPDGSGHDFRPAGDGSYREHNWGGNPEQNYDIQRTADGRYEIAQKQDSASYEKIVGEERARLEKLAEKIDVPEHREQFKKDLEKFGQRAGELEKTYKTQFEKEGLSPEEAAKKAEKRAAEEIIGTYREVGRMMESSEDVPILRSDRQTAAMQVMRHAADPTSIDQGIHPTCNVSTVEARLYSRSPSAVARVVADASLDGECKTRGTPPMTIKLDRKSLEPDQEAMIHPPNSQDRSYASQLFQVTAANMAWERYNQRTGSQIHYEQHEATSPDDSGGRLVDYSKKPPQIQKNADGSPKEGPDINNQEIVDIYNEVAGTNEKEFVIQRPYWVKDKVSNVDSPEALGKRLEEMKKNGEMPAIIHVHSGKEPFYTDSGAGAAGGSGGWHVVTVTDYDPATKKVSIDNQWGETNDRRGDKQIDVASLYNTMTSRAQDLDDAIAADRKNGKIPTVTELERLEMDKKSLSEKEFDEKMVKLVLEHEKAWRESLKKGPPSAESQQEHERTVAKITETMGHLPKARQAQITRSVQKGLA